MNIIWDHLLLTVPCNVKPNWLAVLQHFKCCMHASLCVHVCHIVVVFLMLRQQPCHYHFIWMPEPACPSLLPLNYLPVRPETSGSDPGRLSGEGTTSKPLVSIYHGTNIA